MQTRRYQRGQLGTFGTLSLADSTSCRCRSWSGGGRSLGSHALPQCRRQLHSCGSKKALAGLIAQASPDNPQDREVRWKACVFAGSAGGGLGTSEPRVASRSEEVHRDRTSKILGRKCGACRNTKTNVHNITGNTKTDGHRGLGGEGGLFGGPKMGGPGVILNRLPAKWWPSDSPDFASAQHRPPILPLPVRFKQSYNALNRAVRRLHLGT